MSLDYNYIFSQIDKAKKKKPKHYVPWNSPESKKLQEENAKKEEAKPKTGRARGYGYVSEHATRVPGKTRGPGKKTGKESESTTRVSGRTRGPGKKTGTGEKTTRDSNRGRGTDNARTIAERKEHDRMREVDEKIRAGMTAIPYGHTNIHDYENTLFEQGRANEKKRNEDNRKKRELADRTRGPGETADEYHKRIAAKKKPKKKKVKPVDPHEMIDESEVDVIADSDEDDDNDDDDVGPILQNRNRSTPLWKAWLLKKRRKDRNRLQEINDQDLDNPVGRTKQPKFWKERAEEIKESRLAAEQKKRENNPKFQVDTREGESYKKYKERQDAANDPREHKTLEEELNEGDVKADKYIAAQMAKKKPKATAPKATTTPPGKKQQPAVKPKPATNKPVSTTKKPASVSTPDTSKRDESKLTNLTTIYDPKKDKPAAKPSPTTPEESNEAFLKGKALWKAWLKKKVMTEDEKIEQDLDDDIAVKEKERYDVPLPRVGESDVPCEESEGGCGGHHDTPSLLAIDMAKRRGLIDSDSRYKPKHGYPLENARGHVLPNLTEDVINDKKDKLTNRGKAEEGPGGMSMGAQRGLGHEAGYKQDPGQTAQITEVAEEELGNESKKKSGYQTDQQDESTDVEPNKQQIPASKPGMDVIRSMYKKSLIIKYNNIYKAANI